MKKKTVNRCLALFLVSLAVFSLSSCKQEEMKNTVSQGSESVTAEESAAMESQDASKPIFTKGTYRATATGHNGTLELDVTFTEDTIERIQVFGSQETSAVADTAFVTIPAYILENQTVNVDTVSGATITSAALISAVKDAIVQAGADPSNFMSKPSAGDMSPIELETDLVIVGGGGAGLTAALSAQEKGLHVVVLEKNAMLGGHTALSGGYTLVTGSKLQSETYGITDDSVQSVYDDTMKNGGEKSIPEDLKLFCEKMGEAADWTVDYAGAGIPEKLTALGENSVDRAMVYEGAGHGFVEALKTKLEDTNVDVHLNTKVTSLIVENNKVTGVEAETKSGQKVTVKANAVLIATGSYGARADMLGDNLKNFVFYGAQLAQGEGQEMAQAIGADVVNQGYVELFENGVEWFPGIAKSTYNASMATWDVSGILVDRNGMRVVNERSAGINIVNEMAKQEDGRLFLIMDSDTYSAFEAKGSATGVSKELLDNWLATDGKSVPYCAKADTLEELAKKVGINPENLKETVEKYNQFVKNGVDEDFDRAARYLNKEISAEGPYYVIEQLPRYATTLGGLKIDENLHVINTSGEVIEGLYAAGDVAGGVRGSDSIPGADVAWAVTSGYYAGRVIADALAQ